MKTKVASYLRRSGEFGIPHRDFTVDMSTVRPASVDGFGLERCVSRELPEERSGIDAWDGRFTDLIYVKGYPVLNSSH